MRITILTWALLLLAAFASAVSAQTTYPIQNGTLVDYINYGGSYANVFAADIPETVHGTPYEISVTVHCVPGNAVATSGYIDFVYYPPNGQQPIVTSVPLTKISTNLQLTNPTLTANFSGAFTGSLTFNITLLSRRYGRYDLQSSSFTID